MLLGHTTKCSGCGDRWCMRRRWRPFLRFEVTTTLFAMARDQTGRSTCGKRLLYIHLSVAMNADESKYQHAIGLCCIALTSGTTAGADTVHVPCMDQALAIALMQLTKVYFGLWSECPLVQAEQAQDWSTPCLGKHQNRMGWPRTARSTLLRLWRGSCRLKRIRPVKFRSASDKLTEFAMRYRAVPNGTDSPLQT